MNNFKSILALILTCSAGVSMADATYDTSTSTLTISQVKVGTTLYKSVAATLGRSSAPGLLRRW